MTTCLDDEVGKVLETLRQSGQLERTIVIFASDHGDMLSNGYLRFKGVPYQNAYRTPLIVWGPGVRAGQSGELVNSVDIFPTLLELAGIPRGEGLPGVSVAPAILEGRTGLQKDVLLGLATWRGIYDGRYFYAADNRTGQILPARLTDTQADPYDLENLAGREAYAPLRERMHARLLERLREAGDRKFLAE